MNKKMYTLYFKGINEYGHEHNIPIVSLDLKSMDEYTSDYNDYASLYNALPVELKKYIEDNLSYKINLNDNDDLKKSFFITDEDFSPIMDIIFSSDADVLCITLEELTKSLINMKMTPSEYQKVLLKSNVNEKVKGKYDFFKYLYYTYVLNEKVSCMIDVYDTNKKFVNLASDELMIASIATDKDNIMVLCKKLGQNLESRRNLALKYKELYGKINKEKSIIEEKYIYERKNKNTNIERLIKENFDDFKQKYVKEYQM